MSAVDEVSGEIADAVERPLSEVQKGYTQFASGDVLFAKITPCMENGNAAIVKETVGGVGYGSTEFYVLRPRTLAVPLVYRLVRSRAFRDAAKQVMSGAVGQQRVPKAWMEQHPVPLPPAAEQLRLADKLDSLLAKVAEARSLLEEARETFAERRAAILAAACSGRLTEEWRAEAGRTKSPRGLPQGWRAITMGELCTRITSGSRDWKKYYTAAGPGTFIMAQNVRPLRFDGSFRLAVDPPTGDRDGERSRVQSGDILVTIVGANTGDACRVPDGLEQYYVCQSVALMRPARLDHSPYLELCLNSPGHGQAQYREWLYGQGRPHLSFDQLRATKVLLPPLEEQREIVRRVQSLFDLTAAAEQAVAEASETLEAVTQAILARAFRGELGTNDPAEPSALDLLRQAVTRPPAGRTPRRRPRADKAVVVSSPSSAQSAKSADSSAVPQAILAHLKPGLHYFRSDVTGALGLSAAQWNAAIRELVASGKVVQTGDRRGARYSLPEDP